MGRKIILTGGLGHIGSYLLSKNELYDKWDEVLVLDNLSTNKHHVMFTLPAPITFVEADITTDKRMADYFDGADTVIHLAGIVNAGDTIDKEGLTREVNRIGVKNVVEAAEKAGVKTLIHMSTASVYGPHPEPRFENTPYLDLNPQTPYAKYKLKGERYVTESSILNNYVFRAGTIFGHSPGMRFHTVFNKFLWNAIIGGTITIWKPGTGARPYLSLRDLNSVIMAATSRKSRAESGIYNLATHHWSAMEVVDMIRKEVPDVDVAYITPRILNQDAYSINCSKVIEAALLPPFNTPIHQATNYIKDMTNRYLSSIKKFKYE